MIFMKQLRKNKKGFLLVDSMIGVLILVIGLAALAVLYMQGTKVSIVSDKMQAAVQVAGQEMERLKKADGKSLDDAKDIIAQIATAGGSGSVNYNDDKYVTMRGYTPDTGSDKDKFEITTTLVETAVPGSSIEKGKYANYPVNVEVTWYDPEKTTYTVYGFIIIKND